MKLDILIMAAHPDDAELACSGTILHHIKEGHKVGIIDFTRGELGTRGSAEIRDQEATASSKILGLSARENLYFRDGFFVNDEAHQLKIVEIIRKYQPEIVIANAIHDRHPDHGRGSELASRACFLSGLRKIETKLDNQGQVAWRPPFVYHYIQDRMIKPDFVIDVTPYWDIKLNAIKAFSSQFYNPDNKEPQSYISSLDFLNFLDARARELGHLIGVKYGEGFTVERTPGINNLFDLV